LGISLYLSSGHTVGVYVTGLIETPVVQNFTSSHMEHYHESKNRLSRGAAFLLD